MIKFRRLEANEIEVRVGNVIDTPQFQGCSLLLYKDARVDMNILDETVGCMNWKREHLRENANCIVSIWDDEKLGWVSKEDTGTESNTEAEKGLASDSFKRACVNWGIGRELYTSPKILVEIGLTEKRKVPSNISWYVEKIGYNDKGEINELSIIQKEKGKKTPVFDLKNPIATGNKKEGTQKEEPKKELDFDTANETVLELPIGDIKIKNLTDTQIQRFLKNDGLKKYHGALQVVLDFRNSVPFDLGGGNA